MEGERYICNKKLGQSGVTFLKLLRTGILVTVAEEALFTGLQEQERHFVLTVDLKTKRLEGQGDHH